MTRGDGSGPLRMQFRGGGLLLMRIARAAGGRTIGRKILGLGVPLVAALIHDMKQPDGYLRPFLNRIMHGRPTIRLIDAQHTSVEDKTKKIGTHKDRSTPLNKENERIQK